MITTRERNADCKSYRQGWKTLKNTVVSTQGERKATYGPFQEGAMAVVAPRTYQATGIEIQVLITGTGHQQPPIGHPSIY